MNSSIDISEIKKGIKACLENASELIHDAELLFQNERFARTHTLAQLAIEEIGKSMMLYNFYNSLQMDQRKKFDFKDFRKNFRNHKWKTFESTIIDIWMFAENQESDLNSFSKRTSEQIQRIKDGHFDDLKNDSLYVSIKEDKFHKPNTLFNQSDTFRFLQESKKKIEFITKLTINWLNTDEQFGVDKEGIIKDLINNSQE